MIQLNILPKTNTELLTNSSASTIKNILTILLQPFVQTGSNVKKKQVNKRAINITGWDSSHSKAFFYPHVVLQTKQNDIKHISNALVKTHLRKQ